MTCIAGIEHEGAVYLCGDSAAANGWDIYTETGPKVFIVGEFVIGYTSSFRMGQLLQYQLSVKPREEMSDRAYMITVFAEAVRSLLKDHGYAHIENNEETGGVFLVGYRGHLYEVQSNFAVLRRADGYAAVGCGQSYALGALAVLDKSDPQTALRQALEAAEHFSNGVRGPFNCVTLKPES